MGFFESSHAFPEPLVRPSPSAAALAPQGPGRLRRRARSVRTWANLHGMTQQKGLWMGLWHRTSGHWCFIGKIWMSMVSVSAIDFPIFQRNFNWIGLVGKTWTRNPCFSSTMKTMGGSDFNLPLKPWINKLKGRSYRLPSDRPWNSLIYPAAKWWFSIICWLMWAYHILCTIIQSCQGWMDCRKEFWKWGFPEMGVPPVIIHL